MNLSRGCALAAMVLAGVAQAQTQTALTNGVTRTNLSGAADSVQTFYLDVPAGITDLAFALAGTTGDADIVVNYGVPWSSTDGSGTPACYSHHDGDSNELCEIETATAGTWYVDVYGFTEYSAVSLLGWALAKLDNGTPRVGINDDTDSVRWFYLDVPSGKRDVTFTTSGGTGNANLVIADDPNGIAACTSTGDTNAEACGATSHEASRWYAVVLGAADYSGLSITGSYGDKQSEGGGALPPLTLGVLVLAAAWRRRLRGRPAPAP